MAKARSRTSLQAFDKLTTVVGGKRVIVEQPPLIMHLQDPEEAEKVRWFWDHYVTTVSADRAHLLSQYRVVDLAMKVVGVGSVGTRCWVVLLEGRADLDPLFLQVKEAEASVLEPHLGASEYAEHGERVVVGQRIMQAASDLFLGWATGKAGFHFYVRQLRDMKYSVDMERMLPDAFQQYAELCGATLARAHARSCDPALISGYVGGGRSLARALSSFGVAYADQTEVDHAQLVEAIADGAIPAVMEADR